jgi:hypothetical protein
MGALESSFGHGGIETSEPARIAMNGGTCGIALR